ncbi:MAG: phosphoglycerate mutase family protein [Candidatus Nanoarchaeia archaeon]|nr:phosphoglycerate mutase family protein [Candidatus Nanoarchaeia archaeon]
MKNELIFIRHAKTKVDKEIPIENWILTDEGDKQAEQIANSGKFDNAGILISSDENKAYLTIKPLADKLKKKIIQIKELGEIKRPNSEKISHEKYEEMKRKIFSDLDYTEMEWETANHALNRFKNAVEKIDRDYDNKKILICAHGTIMTLYFAYLLNKLDDLMKRWKSLEFGGYGIVKGGKVIKDII